MRMSVLCIVTFLIIPATLFAQHIADDVNPIADTLASVPGRISSSPELHRFHKDSLSRMEYHSIGHVIEQFPGVMRYDLGNLGQPSWLSTAASSPLHWTICTNGIDGADLLTGMPHMLFYTTEDAEAITLYPMHQSFWYGGAGRRFVVDITEREWDAPRPVTRLRHTEAPNEYLYTDAMFTLNTNERDNIYIAGTRTTIGISAGNDAARFANNRHESWNLRLRYRNHVSDNLIAGLALRYDDDITLLNGGVAGNIESPGFPMIYPPDGTLPFSAEAFDPKSALLVNPSIYTQRQRYSAELRSSMLWSGDSTHMSTIRGGVVFFVSRFRDRLQDITGDSLAEPRLNRTDVWSRYSAHLDHVDDLGWARLTVSSSLAYFTAKKSDNSFDLDGVNAHAGAKLDLMLGPLRATGLARFDHLFGQEAFSIGAGGKLRLGRRFSLWAGAAVTPRPYTLIETRHSGDDVVLIGSRTPPLEQFGVIEAGVRYEDTDVYSDVRMYFASYEQRLRVRSASVAKSTYGRFTTVFDGSDAWTDNVSGLSADTRLRLWRLHLDQSASISFPQRATDALPTAAFPDLMYRGELYYSGFLIEGTLRLRAGGRFEYSSAYIPMMYNPAIGMFTAPSNSSAWSYTDMMRIDLFLFATIKEGATIHLVIHNLLDSRYITTQFYPMNDRALRFGVDWVFLD